MDCSHRRTRADLSARFGNPNSVYRRFRRWAKKGIWQDILKRSKNQTWNGLCWIQRLSEAINRVQGKKSDAHREALGRSRGGYSTKVHALVDALGNPIAFVLSAGQGADISYAQQLLDQLSEEDRASVLVVLADKGYDSQVLVKLIEDILSAKAVIPSRKRNKVQREYDKELYKDRNKVERFFYRIKHYRRVSTRYDKSADCYLSFIHLAAIMQWLR